MSAGDDAAMMRRAIAAAKARLGQTWPNPVVGCVIAKDGVVLAEAVTANGGRPHAEEQALARIGEAARGATAYVTLEPCGERSSGAPSCSERLALAGVERVVIAADNPEPLSAGRGLAHLQEAGVPVEAGFLAEETDLLYHAFRHKLETGLPLVEQARTGEGFDARFESRGDQPLAETLRRYGQTGYTRLWVEYGSDLAVALADLGLLRS